MVSESEMVNMMIRRTLVSILTMLLLPATLGANSDGRIGTVSPKVETIAFIHASVIPMNEERILRDHTVVVSAGRIVAIGPSELAEVPDGAFVVDAAGRYLLPAFCDMHVHLLGEAWNMMLPAHERLVASEVPWEIFLFPYVANGVTLVQDLFSPPEHLVLRERIARGDVLGPRLVLARMMDGPGKAWPPPLGVWVASPEEASEAVRRAKADGYDKVKVYSFLEKESYDAIVSTAKELNMDVIGHIPMSVSFEYVVEAGQKLIAHSEELAKHAGEGSSREKIDEMTEMMAQRGVWLIPTLTTTESIIEIFDDPEGLVSRPEAVYYGHPMERGVWSFVLENLYMQIPAEGQREIRECYERFQRPLTLSFHEKRGKLLAGSDTVLPGLVSGFALHRELVELVAAGLTPYEALRTSTTMPFEYLGESDRRGTIEVGKESDLVLIGANPLMNIANASKVEGVLIQGRWIGEEEIEKKMESIANSFE